ncbi:hypothetical protein EB796_011570 [Bugula neritina]|uniref:Uncharacterized protein n=1 Tax=Bugula neritina TaxID=10212 RepID=A0A7J7JUS6_BUGNE|nr:hypothetical protein EB796_011570 [Bugula neritina]
MNQETVAEDTATSPVANLDFTDHKQAFKEKSLWEIHYLIIVKYKIAQCDVTVYYNLHLSVLLITQYNIVISDRSIQLLTSKTWKFANYYAIL